MDKEELLRKKYEVLKARLNQLIEEHADALSWAQYYKTEYDSAINANKELKLCLEEKNGNLQEKN